MVLSTAESEVLAELLWRTTWQAFVLTLIVFAVTSGLRRWMTPEWRSVLWLVPACRLLMLLVPASAFSLFNLLVFASADPMPIDDANATSHIDVRGNEQPASRSAVERPMPQLPASTPVNEQLDIKSQPSGGPPTSEAPGAHPNPRVSVSSALVGVWLFGCVAAMIFRIRSQIILSRVIANGRESSDPALVEICEARRQSLRLHRKIRCVVVDDDIGPAVSGLLHPRILLPSSLIRDLSAEDLRTILVHEMEHIRRWDGLYSLVGRLVTVIHWFNPLAYVIRRHMRHQIELAVDASTVATIGENMRQSYGELLIQLARRPTRIYGIAHMAAKRSNLRARINELAFPTNASRFRSALAFLAVLALVISGLTDAALTQDPTEALQPQSTAETDQDGKARPATSRPDDAPLSAKHEEMIRRIRKTPNWRFVDARFIERIERRQAELRGTNVTLRGVVIDERKESVPGAFVLLRLPSASSIHRPVDGQVKDAFAVGWTDEHGQFAFDNQPTPWFESGNPLAWEICVFAPGCAVGIKRFPCVNAQMPRVTMRLSRERVINGTIEDSDGNPVQQIEVAHVENVNPYDNAKIEFSLLFSEIQCAVRTDARGRFQIGGLPPQRIASVVHVGAARSAKFVLRVATSSDLDAERMIEKDKPRSRLVFPYLEPTFETSIDRPVENRAEAIIQAAKESSDSVPTRTVTVRVVDADGGGGVSDVGVGWHDSVDEIWISPGMQVTNDEGATKLSIPQRAVDIFVGGRRYGFVTRYRRLTTNPNEYTPTLKRAEWVRRVGAGAEDLEVTFKLRPVAPLQITVQMEDGTPTVAELQVSRRGWSDCAMPVIRSDEQGQATIAVRPVMFDVNITATTKSGLRGSLAVNLSKDFQNSETAVVTVK